MKKSSAEASRWIAPGPLLPPRDPRREFGDTRVTITRRSQARTISSLRRARRIWRSRLRELAELLLLLLVPTYEEQQAIAEAARDKAQQNRAYVKAMLGFKLRRPKNHGVEHMVTPTYGHWAGLGEFAKRYYGGDDGTN